MTTSPIDTNPDTGPGDRVGINRRTLGALALAAPAAALAGQVGTAATAQAAGSNIAPLVIPAVRGAGAHLATVGNPKQRLFLKGVNVWGITDYITREFAGTQYANRDAVCATIRAWGGNHIRLRVLADEYVHLKFMGSTANYLLWIRNWVASAKAHGLYVYISWWDSRDSQNKSENGANWATHYAFAFPMMAAVYHTLKLAGGHDDPAVFYEPFNEPNQVTWATWTPAMTATVRFWRSLGFQGVLVIDTPAYSHYYSDTNMSALESIDASLTKTRRHNLVWARHDYCTDYKSKVFTAARWLDSTGGSQSRHVLLESEFGNANGSASNLPWSTAISAYFHAHGFARPNVAGMSGFLFGNWYDDNAMSTDPIGADPTPWGTVIRNWLR